MLAMDKITGTDSQAAREAELLAWAKLVLERVVARALLAAIHARGQLP
jgi:hypothetical protein